MGPAGLFAALELAKAGYRPLVLERGPAMEERIDAVEKFRKNRILDPEATMHYHCVILKKNQERYAKWITFLEERLSD